jgi:hypothetical protein
VAEESSVDQMIEEGLTRYGRGDLDGALEVWERVLATHPANEQAASYVDYVRQNYDMLTGHGEPGDESQSPYAIEDDEYTVEIFEDKDNGLGSDRRRMDPIDEGWAIDETEGGGPAVGRVSTKKPEPASADAEAAAEATTPQVVITTGPPASEATTPHTPIFVAPPSTGDATTPESPSFKDAPLPPPLPAPPVVAAKAADPVAAPAPRAISEGDPLEPVREFETSNTPVGFAQQSTNVRPRDTGFVKPTRDGVVAPGAVMPAEVKRAPTVTAEEPRPTTASTPPELQMKIRTPGHGPEENTQFTRFGPPPSKPGDFELGAAGAPAGEDPERKATKELANSANIALTSAPTTEIPLLHRSDLDDRRTRDLDKYETEPMTPLPAPPRHPNDTGAHTRDLGIRQRPATKPGESRLKPPAAPSSSAPTTPPPTGFNPAALGLAGSKPISAPHEETSAGDQTRYDVRPVPSDPLEQRAALILDDIDHGAPATESRDDRTRRRITALLDHAADWHRAGELAKAVTAVDLALAEDANTALAQKLIHRNRDTIMTVYQAYLGDLQRAPGLAQPLHELGSAPINPRAAFLLSRIDGTLSVDEILDVSGMPRLEAYRHLCQLLLRGIIK